MTSITVDLGYFAYRYTHARDTVQNGTFGHQPSLSVWDAYMEDIRDRYRFVLENQNDGLDWRVGRVFRWLGAANYYASGFLIERLDGAGAKTDDEWLCVYSGPYMATTQRRSAVEDVFGSPGTYWYFRNGGQGSEGFYAIHYNYKALSDSYDIGLGTDHQTPTSNPYSAAAAFFPDPATTGVTGLQGVVFAGLDRDNEQQGHDWTHLAVLNRDKPFFCLYGNYQRSVRARWGVVSGPIMENVDSADTNVAAHFAFITNPNVNWDPGDDSKNVVAIDPRYNESDVFSVYAHNRFGAMNQPIRNNQNLWYRDKIAVINVRSFKGSIDKDVVCVEGQNATHTGTGAAAYWVTGAGFYGSSWPTTYGQSIKLLANIGVPWEPGQAPPFATWPKYPQRLVKVGP